ncbi:ribonuclease J [Bacillus sp. ISL-40]|uniref:ribonuclease J n=1 Tax=unclassified Bacillus (in: firmicutes) TaxID=185979 RepID=UPI001BE6DC0D|nr:MULTISPECIES: ribonuclease J [unclassified Bacillus (in: firmicutes)]MBT2700047.1 ribonuclease J [Bacillus sp. ISL-40]MBT2720634.1 ribonuclease J [Bacillus sp. ISL-46]MBT2741297.1 ribonuclease J [Bacillus sp. ISL-77]
MVQKINNSIKLITLGGIGEIGKNMYLVEVDKDIFIIDAGLMFPEEEMLGIDIVIPDITYLKENKDRVKAIFLTHGHEDHIGALSYVLRQLDVPVYGTKLTLALANAKLKEQDYFGKTNFIEVDSDTIINLDAVDVSFFKTNHSIPDSVGVCIHTSEGIIVYTGDFKFDQAATKLYKPEIGKMASIGEQGVLCLLSDSTEAEKPGYTASEAIVEREMSNAFYNAPGRIIAACFASDINRIQHIFNAANENGRKVAVVGKSLERIYHIALDLGYLEVAEDLIIPISEIKNYQDREIVVLMTGSQGEPIEALQKMAKQIDKVINIQKGDTVLIAASPLRGSEVFLFKTVDMLFRAGANVISGKRTIHVSSHGSQEELKFMINLMKPKYLIPVHGEYRMLKAHRKLAMECGLTDEEILIPDRGDILEMKDGKLALAGKVPSGNILIDGIGVGDVGNIVLRDRRLLSQDGILIVVVTLTKQDRKIAAGPEIISRGFVYVRESEKLMDDSTNLVRDIVERNIAKDSFEWSSLKQDIREELNRNLYEKTKRRPMILPIIMEI